MSSEVVTTAAGQAQIALTPTELLQLQQVIAAAANEATTVEEALQSGLDLVCAYTGWPVGHAYLYKDNGAGELVSSRVWHLQDPGRLAAFRECSETMRFKAGEGLPGMALQSGKPVWMDDMIHDPRSLRSRQAAAAGLRTAMAFPAWAGKRVVAVLEFFSDRSARTDTQLLKALNFVGTQLGRAIERERAEEALRASEERFRSLVENVSDIITVIDPTGVMLYHSPSVTKSFGYEREEVLGVNAFTLVHPDDVPATVAALGKCLEQPGETVSAEFRIRHKDGSWRIVECKGRSLLAEAGINGVLLISRDITERRAREEKLRDAEAKFRALVEQSLVGVYLITESGFEYFNEAGAKIFGYATSEIIGKLGPLHLTVPEDRSVAAEAIRRRLAGEIQEARYQFRGRRKDGSLVYCEVFGRRIQYQGRPAILGTLVDITERKQAEQELHQTNQRLREALAELQSAEQQVIQQERLRALGTMASGIAHDFNNALMPILGFSELLLHRPATLDDRAKTRQYLEMMNTCARDAGAIVNRLRQFYRHREDDEVFAPIDLNQLVEDAVTLTRPRWQAEAQAAGRTILVHTEFQPVPPLAGSAADLREALTNLIFNAVDAMPNGGTLTLRTSHEDGHAVLAVADTGTGMTEEVQRRCFEPFYSTKGERGTGLGLSMVYGIVQRHGGTVEVQSQPGHGSTFVLRLPLSGVEATGSVAAAAAHAPAPLRLLVVDDEPQVLEVLTAYLAGDGHHVTVARDGREALEKFRQATFDAALLDRAMPGMSGDQLAGILKSARPSLPVVMLTGFGAMMQSAGEIPPHVDCVVSKPVTLQQLREALAKAVSRVGDNRS
jgi:PAS domain S-box-containing protein